MKFFTAIVTIAILCDVYFIHAATTPAKAASHYGTWDWNSWGWGGNSYPHQHQRQHQQPQLRCPSQTEYGDNTRLSNVTLNYPANAITNELLFRTVLFNCLQGQVVLPTAPMVPYDPVIGTAVSTCPANEMKLWSYISPINSGRCWVVQNFQEPVHYVSCLTKLCRRCSTNQNGYGYTHRPRSYTQNTCLKIYRYVQVYAYCENLAINRRIVVERIIVPKECSCRAVQCHGNWK